MQDQTPRAGPSDLFLGIFEGHSDPAVAIVRGGEVLAYAEEERHLRYKHAHGLYPSRALQYCLDVAGATIEDIVAVGINWNLPSFTNGTIEEFYRSLRAEWPIDARTEAWQGAMLRRFNERNLTAHHHGHWRRMFGDKKLPPLHAVPHHYTHAFQACMQSPFEESICVTIDGSGDEDCTVVWHHRGDRVEALRRIPIPHSLGWAYAAFTEYLGFAAYDGEYKVMGLAAYGRPDPALREAVGKVIFPAPDGIEYRVDATYVHYGPRNWSERFTDKLPELFGRPPRLREEEITSWHEDLAYAVQENLEEAVRRLVLWAVNETGVRDVCISGGVGQNIKMNTALFELPEVRDVRPHPLCSDGGAAAGAALAACAELGGGRPEPIRTLALGHQESDEEIEAILKLTLLDYEKPADICEAVAAELARGHIVGWFQGRMEGGPRALGQRSILADPRTIENRDRVNAVIKFREYWRPFCPSMPAEAAERYFERYTDAPFMTIAFEANERLRAEAPAIVHVDGTSRVQMVHQEVLPRYHKLLVEFEKLTGVPVILNTSFNVKGEPIVCTVQDALRTFGATGIEVLAVGGFLIRKAGLSS